MPGGHNQSNGEHAEQRGIWEGGLLQGMTPKYTMTQKRQGTEQCAGYTTICVRREKNIIHFCIYIFLCF